MKKTISFILLASICLISVAGAFAASADKLLTLDSSVIDTFPTEVSDTIKEKISNGEEIFYAPGTKTPEYLNNQEDTTKSSFAATSSIVQLPSSGCVFDYEFSGQNDFFYSPFEFQVVSSCTLKFFRTCAVNGTPSNIKIEKINALTGQATLIGSVNVGYPGTTLNLPVAQGEYFYFRITSNTSGPSYVSFYIYGQ